MVFDWSTLISAALGARTPKMLEWLKTKPWAPFIEPYAPTLNRITAVVVAFANGLGVTFAYDKVAHTATIGNLDPVAIAQAAVSAVIAFIVQEVVYRKVIAK